MRMALGVVLCHALASHPALQASPVLASALSQSGSEGAFYAPWAIRTSTPDGELLCMERQPARQRFLADELLDSARLACLDFVTAIESCQLWQKPAEAADLGLDDAAVQAAWTAARDDSQNRPMPLWHLGHPETVSEGVFGRSAFGAQLPPANQDGAAPGTATSPRPSAEREGPREPGIEHTDAAPGATAGEAEHPAADARRGGIPAWVWVAALLVFPLVVAVTTFIVFSLKDRRDEQPSP
ncbi:MAG TPA: hypothetical protein VNE39_18335 [Planctomycetota bacterium]|nr:hypothetical protein [Planctomycetota bacterium]